MVSRNDEILLKKMYVAIIKEGTISDIDLQEKCGRMSISTYNKLKPYLLRHKTYGGRIEYDKNSKTWTIALTAAERLEVEAKMQLEEKNSFV